MSSCLVNTLLGSMICVLKKEQDRGRRTRENLLEDFVENYNNV